MTEEKRYVVVTVNGKDRPGITAAFTRLIQLHGVGIIDIDQATVHNVLVLSFLLDLGDNGGSRKDSVLKDLLFAANQKDVSLNFQLLSERERREQRAPQLSVVTVFGGTDALADVSGLLAEADANIVSISNISRPGRAMSGAGSLLAGESSGARCVELLVNTAASPRQHNLHERLLQTDHDVALQSLAAYRKGKRLVFFDVDQTLVDMEIIDELARVAGVYDEVSRVTEKAMRGEIDFADALGQRVALLRGLPVERLTNVRDAMRMSERAADVVATLKRLGYVVGVASGGFTFFTDHLRDQLGLDFAHANQLEVRDGVLTGKVMPPVVDDTAKARLIHQEAGLRGILLDQTVAIGDGSNDRLMLGQAGLGIAYNAKRGVSRAAGATLGRTKLIHLLYLLGIAEEDIAADAAGPATSNGPGA